jgi:hypothetical protein
MKDELILQLLLMGISLAVTAVLYWLILMPQWKRHQLMLRAMKVMEDGSEKARELTGKEMLLLREFAAKVSEWDHAQAAKFRRREKSNALPKSEPSGPTPCDSPEESN